MLNCDLERRGWERVLREEEEKEERGRGVTDGPKKYEQTGECRKKNEEDSGTTAVVTSQPAHKGSPPSLSVVDSTGGAD